MLRPFLEAGKIVSTHGLRGEVKIQPWANSPDFLLQFKTLYVDGVPLRLTSARVHKRFVIASFEGFTDIDAAIRLKDKVVSIARADAPLDEGEYFIADLIGLKAVEEQTGRELGTISDVLPLSPNRVYVISGEREILVPGVPEFVKDVDLEAGCVTFRLIEGM